VRPVTHLVLTYGYLAVFGLITAEYIGVPVPGESALIVAAAYAGHTHRLSVWVIFALAVVAAILGDYLGYLAGLKGGYRLLLRWGPVIRLDHAKIKVGWYVFDRHGGKVVFISRFVTVLRTYAAFLAGTNRMRLGRFSLFNVAGGIAWATIYTFISYSAGQLLARMSTVITIIGLAVAVLVVIAVTLIMRRGTARLSARAEAAFPGPLDQVAPGTRPVRKPSGRPRPATATVTADRPAEPR
jgi:membrane protein DedA with SNARE-associated domain